MDKAIFHKRYSVWIGYEHRDKSEKGVLVELGKYQYDVSEDDFEKIMKILGKYPYNQIPEPSIMMA